MWQRIQTLYLALACILIGSMFFCRFATIIGPEGDEVGIRYSEKLSYLLLIIMLFTANVIALMSFKTRLLQMRVCGLAALLLIAFQIWLGVDVIRNMKQMIFSFTTVFPIVAAILDVLAARSIMEDEALVQASSRLRSGKRHKRQ